MKLSGARYFAAFAVLFTTTAAPGQAGNGLALTCVGSVTGATVNFQFRWDRSSAWQDSHVDSGQWRPLTYDFDAGAADGPPSLQVRFDADLAADGAQVALASLEYQIAPAVDCNKYGRNYNFYVDATQLVLASEDPSAGGAVAVPLQPEATPGSANPRVRTAASAVLQRDVFGMVAAGAQLNCPRPLELVAAEPLEGNPQVELWAIRCENGMLTIEVTFTSDGNGGTYFNVRSL